MLSCRLCRPSCTNDAKYAKEQELQTIIAHSSADDLVIIACGLDGERPQKSPRLGVRMRPVTSHALWDMGQIAHNQMSFQAFRISKRHQKTYILKNNEKHV